MRDKKQLILGIAIVGVIVFILIATAMIRGTSRMVENERLQNESIENLIKGVNVKKATPEKGSVNMGSTNLYDELPEIDKYPFALEGKGDVDIEIFTSGEKAGSGTDGWLLETAEKFNKQGNKTKNGKTISISVRSVSSGLACDYIASGKYVPDLYTPSNSLFGNLCMVQGGKLTEYNKRLVGNTAGMLVSKSKGYKDIKPVLDDVMDGKLNIGYTNPQTSATGLNLLIQILKTYGGDNMFSDTAIQSFSKFNENIPFVAYTTQQMRDSASNGTLEGMVTEYQAYINDETLKGTYDFIPFGIRHDNPLYICNKTKKSNDELEAIEIINNYLMTDESQKVATKYGFNAKDDYKDSYKVENLEIKQALEKYKENKDSGKDIIAVFVADCSGSMDGDPMNKLKSSLSNGANYINNNNQIGLVSYSDDVTIELPIAKFDLDQRAYFQGAIDNMMASGGTASYNAVLVAMNMIEEAKKNSPDAKTMIFLLSDGASNGGYSIENITGALKKQKTPVYTISYTEQGDKDAMKALSNINEAASIDADSDDVIYKIKSLFNSQL